MSNHTPLFDRMRARVRRITWQNAVEDTKDLWEPLGFKVSVDQAAQRITISPHDN